MQCRVSDNVELIKLVSQPMLMVTKDTETGQTVQLKTHKRVFQNLVLSSSNDICRRHRRHFQWRNILSYFVCGKVVDLAGRKIEPGSIPKTAQT